ncbi:MAG: hypothetical protein ACO27H_10740, partial [Burkholderiaceae bacterium]
PSAAPATAPAAKPASKAAAPAAPAKPAPAPAADQARLKLEATAPSVDRSAQLRTATAVTLSPEAPDRRAAAAAQWKTLAMDSEQAQREAQRVQALEAEAKAQKQALQKLEASMADVKSQLQRAEDERYLNPFTYVLMALVLGGIGAAAYLWNKLRTMSARREWWDVEDAEGDLPVADVGDTMAPASSPAQAQAAAPATRVMAPAVASVGAAPAASRTQVAPAAAPKAAPVAAPAARAVAPKPAPAAAQGAATSAALQHLQGGVPIRRLNADVVNEVFRLSEPGALDELEDDDKPPAPPPQDQPPFLNSLSTTSVRSVSAEELMDIQQQADFFVSLGQHDQAIDVLRTHIRTIRTPVRWRIWICCRSTTAWVSAPSTSHCAKRSPASSRWRCPNSTALASPATGWRSTAVRSAASRRCGPARACCNCWKSRSSGRPAQRRPMRSTSMPIANC